MVHVLATVPGETLKNQLVGLEPIAPHILVGIPRVLNDHDHGRLKLPRLNTVVVDKEGLPDRGGS